MTLSHDAKVRLVAGAEILGCPLNAHAIEQLDAYLGLVEETNAHTNLTRVTGDEAVEGHFLDALTIVQALDLHGIGSIVDVGTGMGVPGIVLKIVFPHLRLMLVDSLKKRISFLESVITRLHLTNTTALHARAEEIGRQPSMRGQYDCAVARAVAGMSVVAEYCAPLVKMGGSIALYKAHMDSYERELGVKRCAQLGMAEPQFLDVALPGVDAKRTIVTAQRVAPCPSTFPRASNALAKEQDQIREKSQAIKG